MKDELYRFIGAVLVIVSSFMAICFIMALLALVKGVSQYFGYTFMNWF